MTAKPTTQPDTLESSESTQVVPSDEIVGDAPKLLTDATQSSESSEPNPPPLRQTAPQLPHPTRRRRPDFTTRHHRTREDAHQLCGIIFTERRTTAKLLYHLLKVFVNFSLLHTTPTFPIVYRMQVDVIQNWLISVHFIQSVEWKA